MPRIIKLYVFTAALGVICSNAPGQTTIDFQGTGDGKTDNQSAFTSAVTSLNGAGGGTLRIHAGTYAHSGSISFGTATSVICDQSAVLKATSDSAAAFIFTGTNSGIEGCRFISGATAPSSADNAAAVVFSNCRLCNGTGNRIEGAAGDGFLVSGSGSQLVQIKGGFVTGVFGNGVRVNTGASSLVVDGVQIAATGGDCIALISVAADGTQIQDVAVSHNQCLSAAGNGIQIARVLRAKIIDNVVTSPGQHGIIARPFTPGDAYVPDSVDITNNTITNQLNTGYFSVGLQATRNTSVAGNTIRNASGINQWGQSSHLVIDHNKLFNITGDAIKLYYALDHFFVTGNSIFSVQNSCVMAVSVSDGVIAFNTCWDARTSGVTTWGAYHLENTSSVCPVLTGGSTLSGSNFVSVAGNVTGTEVKIVNSSGGSQCITF